jgi:hypothetical protein
MDSLLDHKRPFVIRVRIEPPWVVVYIHAGTDRNYKESVAVLMDIPVQTPCDAARIAEH